MNKIKILMSDHPFISFIVILPFSLVVVFTIIEIIINLVIPFLIASWLTSWVYSVIIGASAKKPIYEPFWFIRSNKF
tara:strand:+ start:243 stop:473 length:231 start_codon:yes stop_codon:yes gene_type:complete